MKKPSIGKTGVHLHYYETGEYRNLSTEQKDELREWMANNPNISKKKAKREVPRKPKSSMKKQVASLVEAELKKTVRLKTRTMMRKIYYVCGSGSSHQDSKSEK